MKYYEVPDASGYRVYVGESEPFDPKGDVGGRRKAGKTLWVDGCIRILTMTVEGCRRGATPLSKRV